MILNHIRAKWKKHELYSQSDLYEDDFFRQYLKQVSAWAYPQIFTKGPCYMLLTHLHALNAKAPFLKEDIEIEIGNWVSSDIDGAQKQIHYPTYKEVLKTVFSEWRTYPLFECLTFEEYCRDPFRWGTPGGAPPVKFLNEKVKSKWAWALEKVLDKDGNYVQNAAVYAESLKSGNVAGVALKEEAQKTRQIITTPISSYLRQAYLLYRRGPVPLPSPISTPSWLANFEESNPSWYGCIDGERFDHSVPADAVYLLLEKLGDLDDETRKVADAEIAHIRSLSVTWGTSSWRYQGGVLSGWRITSLLGSLVSLAAAKFITKEMNMVGALEPGVMGDDIVLTSNTRTVSPENLVAAYNKFGLKANLKKTASGRQGEFLRKVRSPGGSWAFPALDLKTITHAAPWITNFQFSYEEECATAWHTLLSRMLPHAVEPGAIESFISKHTIADLGQRFGRHLPWNRWLNTPLSAGGGGYIERSVPGDWTILEKEKAFPHLTPLEKLAKITGTLPSKRTLSTIRATPIDVKHLEHLVTSSRVVPTSTAIPYFKRNVNVTHSISELIHGRMSISELNELLTFPIPYGMRHYSPYSLADALTTGQKMINSIPSIQHTKDCSPSVADVLSRITRQMHSRRGTPITTKNIRPVATLVVVTKHGSTPVSYGTW